MTLFPHLVRYDLRRFWPMILAWMVLSAVSAVLDGVTPEFARDRRALQAFGLLAVVLWLSGTLLAAVLIARAVQAHRLVGTTAFWLTRPIPPIPLLLAKLVWLSAVIVLWPVLCEVVLMALHRAPAGDIAAVSVTDVGWRLVLLMALMGAAALTASLTGFFVLCASVLVGTAMATAIYVMVEASRTSGDNSYVIATVASLELPRAGRTVHSPLPDAIRVVLTLFAFAAALIVQYRLRSRSRAAAIGVVGIVIALAVPAFGPPARVLAASSPPTWADRLALSVESPSLNVNSWVGWPDVEPRMVIRGFSGLTGLPPGWVAHGRLIRATVEVGQTRLESRAHPAVQAMSEQAYGQGSAPVLRDVLGVRQIADDYQLEAAPTVLFVAGEGDLPALTSGPANYQGTYGIDLTQVEVAGVLPLARGATFRDGGYRIVLGDIFAAHGAVWVGARVSAARNIFTRRPEPSYSFYLRNRMRSEAAGATLQSQGVGQMMPFLFGLHLYRASSLGFSVAPAELHFRNMSGTRHAFANLDAEWLREAELVVVRTQYVASVERQLTMSRVVIRPRR